MSIYCVYFTMYSGSKLPPFYIGSSSVEKVNSGYHGSVKSKAYKDIWKKELNENPHLFKTQIICTFDNRKDATGKEGELQKALNVIKSPLYVNKSIASAGSFCLFDARGKDHHNFGKIRSDETRAKISKSRKGKMLGHKHTDETRAKITEANTGKSWWNNGVKNVLTRESPGDEWSKGQLPQPSRKEFKWWNDGVRNVHRKDSPGPEWYPGRISWKK